MTSDSLDGILDQAAAEARRSRRGWNTVLAVSVAAGAALVSTLVLLAGGALGWWHSPGWIGVVGGVLVGGAGAAAAAGGALDVPRLFRRGLLPTPHTPWHLEVDRPASALRITMGTRVATVPLDAVRRARLFVDDNLDGIRGVDDTLELTLADARIIRIPGSATGFVNVIGICHDKLERVFIQ